MLPDRHESGGAERRRAIREHAEDRANISPCCVCGRFFYEDFSDLIEMAIHDAIAKLGREVVLEELSFEPTCGDCADM